MSEHFIAAHLHRTTNAVGTHYEARFSLAKLALRDLGRALAMFAGRVSSRTTCGCSNWSFGRVHDG
jgi:hypothetical protein